MEVLPLIFCLIFYKKIKQNYFKAFFIYTISLAFFICSALYLSANKEFKEIFIIILRAYIFIEYIIFSFFFFFLLKNKIAKIIVLLSIIPFAIFCIANYILADKNKFDNYPPLLEFTIFLAIIGYYFFEKMKFVSKIPLHKQISFWLCVGLLIYFSGNFFYYLLITSTNDLNVVKQMKIVGGIVNITKDLILSFAWFAHERVETDSDIIKIPDGLGLDDDLPFIKKPNP